jgi:formamidopyrimidine-DNA glycosylase
VPEGLEAEIYRRSAERALHRRIAAVDVDERQAMAPEIRSVLPGAVFTSARRHGKLVLLDTAGPDGEGPTLGLHFGMTGRLIVDGGAAIDRLEYASGRDAPAWDRLVVTFDDGGQLRVNDPRRWAQFTLDPDDARLGPDVLDTPPDRMAEVLTIAFARRRAAVKAVLLDQATVAGFGNLCVDEILWQAGLDPARSASTLSAVDVAALVAAMAEHLPAMLERGGSHRGTIDPEVRASLPPCPRDGSPLERTTVGGRTTVRCPSHQR